MSILLDRSNRVLIQGVTGAMGTFFVEDGAQVRHDSSSPASRRDAKARRSAATFRCSPACAAAREATGADSVDRSSCQPPPCSARRSRRSKPAAGWSWRPPTSCRCSTRSRSARRRAPTAPHSSDRIRPGIISPGKAKLGFMPSFCYKEGSVGVISRSGSLSYECCKRLTLAGHRAVDRHRHRRRSGERHDGGRSAGAFSTTIPTPTRCSISARSAAREEIFVAEYARAPTPSRSRR